MKNTNTPSLLMLEIAYLIKENKKIINSLRELTIKMQEKNGNSFD